MDTRGSGFQRPRRQLLGEPDGKDRRLLFSAVNMLQAIDARHRRADCLVREDGKCRSSRRARSGPNDLINEPEPGRVFENLLILGSATNQDMLRARRHPRVRRPHRRAGVDLPHRPAPGRARYDTWPKDAWKTIGGANNWESKSIDASAASSMCRPAAPSTTSMEATGKARICSATASSRSMRGPASACGTSRPSTTTSGTSTTIQLRS